MATDRDQIGEMMAAVIQARARIEAAGLGEDDRGAILPGTPSPASVQVLWSAAGLKASDKTSRVG